MTSCSTTACGVGGWGGPQPGDPDNNSILSATPAFGGIDVSWSYPTTNPAAVAHVLLYRAIIADFNAAIQIATVGGNFFYDKSSTTQLIQYFYWIKIVSVNGTVGALIGPASATARPTIEQVIEQLSGKIEESALAQGLRTQVNQIAPNYADLQQEIANRVAANTALSTALATVQAGVNQSITLLDQEITQRQDGDSALIGQVNTIAAGNANALALIQAETTARVSGDQAVASQVTTLSATVDSKFAEALTAANVAKAAADAANLAIDNIASDSILSPSEKPLAVREYAIITGEQAGLTAQGTAYAITTALTAYTSAITALTTYLNGLTGWNVIPGSNVTIVGATFRSKFADVYTAKQALLNAIVAKAKVLADAAQTTATQAAADIVVERQARISADSALAQDITTLQTASTNASSGILDLKQAKIGYAALTGTSTPYDGDNTTIVYPSASYPDATYPEYAVNRRRIIDKVGVTNWNATPAGVAKPLSWLVGMPMATAVKAVQVTGPDGTLGSVESAMTAQKTLNDTLKAQFTVKTDLAGRVAGFGLASESTTAGASTSDFAINADRVWIGAPVDFSQETAPTTGLVTGKTWYKPSTRETFRYVAAVGITPAYWQLFNPIKPFIVTTTGDSPGVYINDAYINKLTFSKLRDETGNFLVENGKVKADYLNVIQINGGSYTGYAWPAGGTGFHIGPSGLLMGRYDANNPSSGYFQYDVASKALYTNGMSIVNGVLSISQANVINTINIAGESVVVVDQFNFTKYGNGGSNTGSHTDTYSFYMASAGYVHITAISTFFTNSPPADVSETNFYVDGSFIGGRNGTGTLSTLPKVVIAKRYLTAGWHSGTAVHTYSSIEVNDVLNLTDVLILKAYR